MFDVTADFICYSDTNYFLLSSKPYKIDNLHKSTDISFLTTVTFLTLTISYWMVSAHAINEVDLQIP